MGRLNPKQFISFNSTKWSPQTWRVFYWSYALQLPQERSVHHATNVVGIATTVSTPVSAMQLVAIMEIAVVTSHCIANLVRAREDVIPISTPLSRVSATLNVALTVTVAWITVVNVAGAYRQIL